MPLKITRASEPIPVETLTIAIYAQPGCGKTSMAFTADKTLLLDFDEGAYRARNRGDVVQVRSWSEVEDIGAADLEGYNTVAIDTAGRALDWLTQDIIARNPKHGRGGALTLQGYGELKSRFTAWVKMVRSIGKDVILIIHMDEQKSGDETKERLDMAGGSKNEVYKVADAIGRIQVIPGQRFGVLNFNPSDTAFGKNPGQLDPIVIPDFAHHPQFLAEVITTIKQSLNTLTEAQQEECQRTLALREELSQLDGVDAFNSMVEEMADSPPKDKALLVAIGQESGLVFDKQAKRFCLPETEEAMQ